MFITFILSDSLMNDDDNEQVQNDDSDSDFEWEDISNYRG